ncbi:MAG TPA: hypothetical protein VFS20_14410 [Longimicrobium sp.]|nr:hypothetical protein [Longimicrobium sp.]
MDRALTQDTRRLTNLLGQLYEVPESARDRFRARAAEIGPQSCGRELAADPARFGTLRTGLTQQQREGVAAEAGYIAGIAYALQANRSNAPAVAKLLTERFYRAAATVFERPSAVYASLIAAAQREGPAAAARLQSEPESFGELRPGGDRYARALASRAEDLVHARGHAGETVRTAAAGHEPGAGLPRNVRELRDRPGGRLPRTLEIKLEAFTSDFRAKLAAAYLDPEAAERKFHEIIGREGAGATVFTVRRSPQVLGALGPNPNAALVAGEAARRGARAYELHNIQNPAHAADVLQRETESSLARQCAEPATALRNVLDAIRRHGLDRVADEVIRNPEQHFGGARAGTTLNGPALSAQLRELSAAMQVADRYVDAATDRIENRVPPELPLRGAAFDAVQAHVDASALASRRDALQITLNNSSNALDRAERAEQWDGIRTAQLDSELRKVYRDPIAARENLLARFAENGAEPALRVLEKNPQEIGTLVSTPRAVRRHAAEAALYARTLFNARTALAAVRYTDSHGREHLGAQQVKEASTADMGVAAADLRTTTERLEQLGKVDGTRERAVSAVQALSPEQADQLLDAVRARNTDAAAAPIQAVKAAADTRRNATSLFHSGAPHLVLQTAQVLRSMGEGPTL